MNMLLYLAFVIIDFDTKTSEEYADVQTKVFVSKFSWGSTNKF